VDGNIEGAFCVISILMAFFVFLCILGAAVKTENVMYVIEHFLDNTKDNDDGSKE